MLEIFNEFIPIFSTTQDELEEKSLLSETCLGVDTNARGTTRNLWLRGERRRRGNCGRRRDLGSIYMFTQYLSSDRFRRGASRVSDDSVKSIGAVFVKIERNGQCQSMSEARSGSWQNLRAHNAGILGKCTRKNQSRKKPGKCQQLLQPRIAPSFG